MAINVAVNTRGRKSLCNSSRTNISPANGALNAAASPAPAPAETRVSLSCIERRGERPIKLPMAPPICTDGPSLPSVNPVPIATAPAKNFTNNNGISLRVVNRFNTSSKFGIPLPLALGAYFLTRPAELTAPRPPRRDKIIHPVLGSWPWSNPERVSRYDSSESKTKLNATATTPA